jgi:hypothetical protein
MTPGRAAFVAACVGALAAVLVHRLAPEPSADVARGSEDAFAVGLHQRELPPRQAPIRWTTPRALFRFRLLPPGPALLEVAVHGQRGPAIVAANGLVIGALDPSRTSATFPATVNADGRIDVELRAEGPTSDARRLGAMLDHVSVSTPRTRLPPLDLLAAFVVPALAAAVAAGHCGLPAWAGALAALGVALVQAFLCWPCGLVRAPYAVTLSLLLSGCVGLSASFAAWARRWGSQAPAMAFVALLSACLVQGVAATSPLMVVSDAVFHANKLAAVAGGDLFPTSRTQHAQPFQIPYGATFYALLVPFFRLGLDPVWLVRCGAALSGVAASAALFALIAKRRTPLVAGLAVVALQLLPGTFDVYSFGNFSNVFGQALTVLFFAWWAGGRPGGWAVGALALALGATAHLSSLVVLSAVVLALVLGRGREGLRDRPGLIAVAVGLGLALAYYGQYGSLISDQLPRLLEGGGQGRGASVAVWGALRTQLVAAVSQWGWPAILLGLAGLPRPSRSPWDRDSASYGIACLALFVPAIVSPLDVRYIYALSPIVSIAASETIVRGAASGGLAGLAVSGLSLWALLAAARSLCEALLARYR